VAQIRRGWFTSENFVQNQAQRINVTAPRYFPAGSLLGRHVGRRSAANVHYFTGYARQAEVGDTQLALPVEHDVTRLQIAVQHAFIVRGGQAGAELAGDFQRLVRRQPPDRARQRAQILAIPVFQG